MEAKGDSVFRVYYGSGCVNIDVTFDTLLHCCQSTTIDIPGTNREQDALFSDPLHGVTKHISIQENDQTRAFTAEVPVHYQCLMNGEMLRYANMLRKKNMSGENFAMQLVTAMYAPSEGCLLKVGARYGVPQPVLIANHVQATIVEADYNRALMLAAETEFTVRPLALAYQPIVLVGSHLESLDALQSAINPQNNNTVVLHDNNSTDVSKTEETKSISSNSTLPSIMSSDVGLQRRTLLELEEAQNNTVFETLVFDSLRAFESLLREAAPMVLRHAKHVIVGSKIPQHRAFTPYVNTQMGRFGFKLHKTFAYRTTFEVNVWRRNE